MHVCTSRCEDTLFLQTVVVCCSEKGASEDACSLLLQHGDLIGQEGAVWADGKKGLFGGIFPAFRDRGISNPSGPRPMQGDLFLFIYFNSSFIRVCATSCKSTQYILIFPPILLTVGRGGGGGFLFSFLFSSPSVSACHIRKQLPDEVGRCVAGGKKTFHARSFPPMQHWGELAFVTNCTCFFASMKQRYGGSAWTRRSKAGLS